MVDRLLTRATSRRPHLWALVAALVLGACSTAESKPDSDDGILPIAPPKYEPFTETISAVEHGTDLWVTAAFRIRDGADPVPEANVRLRVTRGTLDPALIHTSTLGRGSSLWILPPPVAVADTLYACAVDSGYDCVPTFIVVSSNIFYLPL